MDVYNGYHYQHAPDMSIRELVECDMKELDVNYNDPAFDGSNIYPDAFHHQIKCDKSLNSPMKIHGSLPADLTNLQWLQHMNVALPVEHGGVSQLHDTTVMVDPNTAMPVQANGWIHHATPPSAIHTTNVQQQITQRRQAMDKPKKLNTAVPISAKEDTDTKEKPYPKPVFSYSCLIAMALQDSEAGTLPVSEIYKFMQSNFPYFKTAPDGWKNSVRHNLSLNKAFCKLERPQGTSQRKGCLWTLKPEKKEQMMKEIKKWKKKHTESIKASMARPDEFSISGDELTEKFCLKRSTNNPNDHYAAADAAKDLFGNGIMEEINSETFWDDIMSSSSPDSLKYVDPSCLTSVAHERYPSEVSTTVEVDSSSHFYGNEYDHHIPNIGNAYYSSSSSNNNGGYPQAVSY